MSDNAFKTTWSLVIATYKRQEILLQCIGHALSQTRPPLEIVVVDASPEWEESKNKVQNLIFDSSVGSQIELKYEKAKVASSAAQRNQGADLARGDVLFLIDDDSLMFRDCAECVMKIYDADVNLQVAGVSTNESRISDPVEGQAHNKSDNSNPANQGKRDNTIRVLFTRLFRRVFNVESTVFLPYDISYPSYNLPDALSAPNIGVIHYITGCRMTIRRRIFEKERFTDILKRYASGEDLDFSYRASRHGALLLALDAYVNHLEVSGGRLSLYQVTILAALNPAVLQQFYSPDRNRVNSQWKKILYRRLFIGFFKDLRDRSFKLPRTRGLIFAIKNLNKIYRRSGDELRDWYSIFQDRIISNN